jgi:hypothetical protein
MEEAPGRTRLQKKTRTRKKSREASREKLFRDVNSERSRNFFFQWVGLSGRSGFAA